MYIYKCQVAATAAAGVRIYIYKNKIHKVLPATYFEVKRTSNERKKGTLTKKYTFLGA